MTLQLPFARHTLSSLSRATASLKHSPYNRTLHDGEVRILTVQPGSFDAPTRCFLSIENLDNALPYDAVSYCWGEAVPYDRIWLNNQRFSVSRNVFEALQYLRSRRRPLRLWIDALCIAQNDIAEKNAQVQQMGQIYERARKTIVWLGPPNPNNPDALDALVDCSKRPISPQLFFDNYASNKEIFCRPWMSRAWVVQEVALSPRCIVYNGHSHCDIRDLYYATHVFFNAAVNIEDSIAIDPQATLRGGVLGQTRLLLELEMMDNRTKRNISLELLILLDFMRERQCSDPRDKYYGLRGIDARLNEPRNILVDYARDAADFYIEVTRCGLLEGGKGLSCLAVCHREKEIRTELGAQLPSWVPDWQDADPPTHGRFPAWEFTAGGPPFPGFSETMFTSDGRSLRVEGFIVTSLRTHYSGTISSDGDESQSVADIRVDKPRSLEEDMERWVLSCQPLRYSNNDEAREAFRRSLTMDIEIGESVTAPSKRRSKGDDERRLLATLGKS